MSQNKYPVVLSPEQRQTLLGRLAAGKAPTGEFTHVRILLKADQSQPGARWTDQQIASALEVSRATVLRVRQRFVQEGWMGQPAQAVVKAVRRRPAVGHRPRKLDGAQEAHLIALACSGAPEGYDHWSLRLLADRLVQLEIVEHISPETVRHVLKKTNSSRG